LSYHCTRVTIENVYLIVIAGSTYDHNLVTMARILVKLPKWRFYKFSNRW